MYMCVCVTRFFWPLIKVTFGEHDYCNATRKPETRFVLRSIVGEFSYLNFQNDLALLRLNDNVPITATTRPICLPTDTSAYTYFRLLKLSKKTKKTPPHPRKYATASHIAVGGKESGRNDPKSASRTRSGTIPG